jgi:hypothetical protein
VIAGGIVSITVRAWQQRDLAKWAMFAVLPFLYFYSVSTKQLIFARYLLPVLPFMFIFMASGIVELLGLLRWLNQPVWTRRLAAAAVCASALFPVAQRSHGRATMAARRRRILPTSRFRRQSPPGLVLSSNDPCFDCRGHTKSSTSGG